jgi:hypothetical protein
MKKALEVLFILALLSMPIAAFIAGQVWLGLVFVIFYAIFGIIEVVAKKKTGKTVSQHFWTLTGWKKWMVIGAMILGWSALILHFLKVLP